MRLKKILANVLILAIFAGCDKEDRNTDYLNDVPAPSNVDVAFRVTQDNTGLVSLTPSSEGATSFTIDFGDDSELESLQVGETALHVYEEGVYAVSLTAKGINGLTTLLERELVVAFIPPQNLEVTVENVPGVTKTVRVNATADFGIFYEVDFGDDSDLQSANMGEEIVYSYAEGGFYDITVAAYSAAEENTVFVVEDFEVIEINEPLEPAPTPSEPASGVIAIYSDTYTPITTNEFPTEWSDSGFEEIQIEGNNTIKYTEMAFTGIVTDYANPTDLTGMDFVHFDYWTTDGTSLGFKIVNTAVDPVQEDIAVVEEVVQNEWVSVVFDLNDYDMDRSQVTQLLFDALGNRATFFIDNIYFSGEPEGPSPIVGQWRMANEDASLGVGPAPGDVSWFNCSGDCLTERACYFDDLYVFGIDGSFSNILQDETWIEGWQSGEADACGTPVAPYDGTGNYTYSYNEEAGTITVNGVGAYIGLPKANNQGELPNVDVPDSITYVVELTDGGNGLDVYIESGSGVFWQYKLERVTSPLEGTWKMANEDASLGVGPAPGDVSWFNCAGDCLTERACYFDDEYVFGPDGSFQNVLQNETWIEGWQSGEADACGIPVAPHDGSSIGTFLYNEGTGQLTINGEGLYVGLPKANNQGELPNVEVPSTIVYDITLSENNTVMNVVIETGTGSGVFWQFKLIKN